MRIWVGVAIHPSQGPVGGGYVQNRGKIKISNDPNFQNDKPLLLSSSIFRFEFLSKTAHFALLKKHARSETGSIFPEILFFPFFKNVQNAHFLTVFHVFSRPLTFPLNCSRFCRFCRFCQNRSKMGSFWGGPFFQNIADRVSEHATFAF